MKNYWLIRMGRSNKFAKDAIENNYVGVGWFRDIDLTTDSNLDFKSFKEKYAPKLLKSEPGKTKVSAGLNIGNLWVVIAGVKESDVVVMPAGEGQYRVGEVISSYQYERVDDKSMPHRRKLKWLGGFQKDQMTEQFRNSAGSIMTAFNISPYANEIEKLLGGSETVEKEDIENITDFGLEAHLEEFLVFNWKSTILGKKYDIYQEEGETVGQQYLTDVGRIDILALSKDKKTWLIVELKKGHSSDSVVGQMARYIGYAKRNIAEKEQKVRGIIIAGSDDINIQYGIQSLSDVEFMTYEVSFKLK